MRDNAMHTLTLPKSGNGLAAPVRNLDSFANSCGHCSSYCTVCSHRVHDLLTEYYCRLPHSDS